MKYLITNKSMPSSNNNVIKYHQRPGTVYLPLPQDVDPENQPRFVLLCLLCLQKHLLPG